MASRVGQIKTFQRALDSIGFPIVYHTTQFYSVKQHRPVTQYHIKKVIIDEESQRAGSEEMFNTYYQMYVIFFLRDVWDYLHGRELDTSNQYWEDYKKNNNIVIEEVVNL